MLWQRPIFCQKETLAFAACTPHIFRYFSHRKHVPATFHAERCTSTETFLPKNVAGVLYLYQRKVGSLDFVSTVLLNTWKLIIYKLNISTQKHTRNHLENYHLNHYMIKAKHKTSYRYIVSLVEFLICWWSLSLHEFHATLVRNPGNLNCQKFILCQNTGKDYSQDPIVARVWSSNNCDSWGCDDAAVICIRIKSETIMTWWRRTQSRFLNSALALPA